MVYRITFRDFPRESPAFLLNGNEWFFRFFHQIDLFGPWCYVVYLELKNKRRKLKPCSVSLQVGFKSEKNLSLGKEEFTISEHLDVWCILEDDLCSKLPRDYCDGNWIKFVFRFHDAIEPLYKNIKETKNQPKAVVGSGIAQEYQKSVCPGTNIHFQALSRDISKLMDENSTYDVKITCEDKIFNAHRIILGTRSTVFSAMLKSNMTEGESGLIKLEDIKASVFQKFLRYLYSGSLPELNVESAKEFYEISDKYAVEEFKKACSEYLTKNLSEDNACEILALADQHSDRDFRANVISYVIEKKIPEMDDSWFDFCDNYPKLSNEILNLYIRRKRSK